MPITIPPFDQYQQPVIPLRGLWNTKPAEGDMFAQFEIDWLVTTRNKAVQILFSSNSPVAFSQIVALAVDNRNSGYDVNFLFPDSGFVLTAPAYNQLITPVFTNALMFYVIADPNVVAGNRTVFMVLNSMPPPLALNPTSMQTTEAVQETSLAPGTTAQIIPANVSGTLNGFTLAVAFSTNMNATFQLKDGVGDILWQGDLEGDTGVTVVVPISGMHARFVNGLSLVIPQSSNPTGGTASINVFYVTP